MPPEVKSATPGRGQEHNTRGSPRAWHRWRSKRQRRRCTEIIAQGTALGEEQHEGGSLKGFAIILNAAKTL